MTDKPQTPDLTITRAAQIEHSTRGISKQTKAALMDAREPKFIPSSPLSMVLLDNGSA
jgi:hypothetical protein